MVNFSGKSSSGGPLDVRLGPCGTAKARLVDPGGKPFAGSLRRGIVTVTMAITPGPRYSNSSNQAGLLAAEEASVNILDPVNYPSDLASNAEGRIKLSALIPGATYRLIDYSKSRQTDPQIRKSFTVKHGEELDLGDVLIEKPPG